MSRLVNVRLGDALEADARNTSARLGVSLSQLLRAALRRFLRSRPSAEEVLAEHDPATAQRLARDKARELLGRL